MKIAIVTPYAPTFLHFRGPLVKYLREQGHDLALFAPDWTPELRRTVEGFSQGKVESYPLDRTGVNPLGDLRTLAALSFSFLYLSPQVVLTFQPKPNVYGILAAGLARVPLRAAVVEGLGFAFTPGRKR
ncbi:hypothetical protein [Limisphaera sp. 4302-co]|uniref:hypothetical protein n=1 Tax=Limisphaera sp. 4302-co TaxID=3400417 RepID=UPI003C23F733